MNAVDLNPNSPETAKFLAWFEGAKKRGLMDVKFYARNVEGATVESFFSEVNMAMHSERVNRPDFF